MIKTTFLIPETDNDGRPYSKATWRELERRLFHRYGAFSLVSGVRGVWQFQGRVYEEVPPR